jgi:Cytochrome P460
MPPRAISSQNSKNAIESALKDQYRLKGEVRERAMKRITFSASLIIAAVVAVVGGRAISAEDKYTLQVPGGLAFSEFRGYEGWSVIAISENGGHIAVIMGNPAMIDAYKKGVPGNGKPFPDGARMAKIHWIPKKQETYPGQPTVPGIQHDVDFMVKDSKRFADSGGWGYAEFEYNAASDTFRPGNLNDEPPQANDAKCGYACHTIVQTKDYVFTEYGHR